MHYFINCILKISGYSHLQFYTPHWTTIINISIQFFFPRLTLNNCPKEKIWLNEFSTVSMTYFQSNRVQSPKMELWCLRLGIVPARLYESGEVEAVAVTKVVMPMKWRVHSLRIFRIYIQSYTKWSPHWRREFWSLSIVYFKIHPGQIPKNVTSWAPDGKLNPRQCVSGAVLCLMNQKDRRSSAGKTSRFVQL